MAAYVSSRVAPFGAVTIFRAVQFFSEAGLKVSKWNSARVTRIALSKLTDRELDDIGLCRGDVALIGR